MTRKALARRIAEPYLTSQQRREAPAPPQPEGLRGFWPGALLLVSQRPQRVFSFLLPVRLGPSQVVLQPGRCVPIPALLAELTQLV
jgi:hypothetical protein